MGGVAARLRDPLLWTDVLQLVKTAAAAVIAWMLAVEVFSLPQSFLAFGENTTTPFLTNVSFDVAAIC